MTPHTPHTPHPLSRFPTPDSRLPIHLKATMTEQLTVHEFSRKLLEPKQVQGQWVSTGFDQEIGLKTQEVPPVIEKAVHNDEFRLNENYPPAEGEMALIAREIEQYAVLAVVTPLVDDSARPCAGYRYFWLEKPSQSGIDGVGTLLNWWDAHNQPRFELKPHPEILQTQATNHKKGFYQALSVRTESLSKSRPQVDEMLPQIPHIPHIFPIQDKPEKSPVPNYWELHSLALALKHNQEQPIAWAWKATFLENPAQLTLICCAAEKFSNLNSKYRKIESLPLNFTSQPTSPNSSVGHEKKREIDKKTPNPTPAQIVQAALEKLNLDLDGDGLSTREERNMGLDPYAPDSDGDRVPDGSEVAHGSRPGRKDNKEREVEKEQLRARYFQTACSVLGWQTQGLSYDTLYEDIAGNAAMGKAL
ncbi:MAG: hypothetical protein ACRDEA_07285, partial [Microcystaceae cyanobacterium]